MAPMTTTCSRLTGQLVALQSGAMSSNDNSRSEPLFGRHFSGTRVHTDEKLPHEVAPLSVSALTNREEIEYFAGSPLVVHAFWATVVGE